MASLKMPEWLISAGGWITALIVGILTAIVHLRKGHVDETAMVLGKWKDLVDAHQTQITGLTAQISAQAVEISELRSRLNAAETRVAHLEEENAGLKRIILQNSQSTVLRLNKKKDI